MSAKKNCLRRGQAPQSRRKLDHARIQRNHCRSHRRIRSCDSILAPEEQVWNLKLADQKREAYGTFLENFTATALAVMHDEDVSGKDADRERMLARDKLLLYASDEVIKAYDAWIRYSDEEKQDLEKEGDLLSLVFLAIRKDLLGTTKLTKDDLANLNPFNRG
ncbi:MAG: hypothetical protein ABSC76_14280 [Terracidiphilus sp.]